MFTGIVRETGEILLKDQSEAGAVFEIRCRELAKELEISHSISVDGCCLTVTEKQGDCFKVEVTPETLRKTNLGAKIAGDPVNLEPAAKLSDFLGGHLVQGHVDETGNVVSIVPEGNSRIFRFSASEPVLRYCSYKGSITVNGVSLTISALHPDSFEVTIIPHTSEITNFGNLEVGDQVNLEADIISKYVESHVKRLMGIAGAILLLVAGFAGVSDMVMVRATDLPLEAKTILIYTSEVAERENSLVLRVARFQPDRFVEWETLASQGTIHLFKRAVKEGNRFFLDRLFEPGVDVASRDGMTIWLSEKIYQDLIRDGMVKIQFNNTPLKMTLEGEETFVVSVDKRPVEVAAIRLHDDRKGVWLFHKDPNNPIMLEFTSRHYRQYLKSISTKSWPGLRWIRELPKVK
jgi:riboflavin synthase